MTTKHPILFILFLFFAAATHTFAQNGKTVPCKNYDCAFSKAKAAYFANDFVNAFKFFKAAKAFDATKTNEIDIWIEKTFTAINAQRDEARKAKDFAVKARAKTDSVLLVVKQEKQNAILSRNRADSSAKIADVQKVAAENQRYRADSTAKIAEAQRKKAQDVLDKIYFYEDKFGLAYDKNENKYGFIDKDLNTTIKFKYNEAVQFKYPGFARVKINTSNFYIDTEGKEYKLVTEIGELDNYVLALDMRQKRFKQIPTRIFQNVQLSMLFLNTFNLTTLSSKIGKLNNLTYLSLSNKSTEFNTINFLDVSDKDTKKPYFYSRFPTYKFVDTIISKFKNKVTLIAPKKIFVSTFSTINSIVKINSFDILPREIGNLKKLIFLFIENNRLTFIPKEIGDLKNLKDLRLTNNELINLPVEIGNLNHLTFLDLSYNQLKLLPLEIGKLYSLKNLDLQRNKLTTFLPEIGKLCALTSLDLAENQLTTLPPEIGKLSALTRLNLGGNQLTILPAEIGELSALTSLDLGFNRLTNLPSEIGKLSTLKFLYLGGNNLTTLPAEIEKLSKLDYLDLRGNPISVSEKEKIKKLLPNCNILF